MEYQINVDKVEKDATKEPINPKYHSVPKEWVDKFLVTIWKDCGREGYLDMIMQKTFDTPEEALNFATKFKHSRRKSTTVHFNNNLKLSVRLSGE